MNRPGVAQGAILAVAALLLFGVHKSDHDTQAKLAAQAYAASIQPSPVARCGDAP